MHTTKSEQVVYGADFLNPIGEARYLLERRFFNSLLSVIFTFICLLIIDYYLKYIPNNINMENIKNIFFERYYLFAPEAPERAKYILTTLLFPVFFTLFYWIACKIKIKTIDLPTCNYILPVVLVFEIYTFYICNAANQYMLQYSMLYKAPLFSIILSMLFFLLLWFPWQKYQNIMKISEYICLLICTLSVLYVSGLYIIDVSGMNSDTFFNFDVYYYSVFEVFNGKTLMVDFNNIYGFYPYLITPILKLTGSISILKFNIIMAVLVFITLMSLLAVVWMNIKNKIIALIGYLALLYFTFILAIFPGKSFYYAYQPHRLIFPALILLAGSILLHTKKQPQKSIVTFLGFILVCLSLIWNVDTGIVLAIVWCLFLIYIAALDYSLNRLMLYQKSLTAIALTTLAAISSYGIIALITYEKSGIWISVSNCFYAQNIFYNYGFNMLAMPAFHPWVILVILYVIGLIISLRNIKFLNKDEISFSRSRSSMYFFLSIIGVGVFSYYQGRSHDSNLTSVVWPGVIITVMLLEDYYISVRSVKNTPKNLSEKLDFGTKFAKYVLLLILLVSFALAVPYTVRNDQILLILQYTKSSDFSNHVKAKFDLIKNVIGDERDVDLLISQADNYYTMLGLKNPTDFNFGVQLFIRTDYDNALQWLKNTQDVVILDEEMIGLLKSYKEKEFNQIIENRYNVQSLGEELYVCTLK